MLNISKTFLLSSLFVTVLFGAACRSGGAGSQASVKDVGLSPADLSKDSPVIYAIGKLVHYGVCPVGSSTVSRNCLGLADRFIPIAMDKYSSNVVEAMVAARPAGTGTKSPQIVALEDKITRLKDKIAAGGLSAATTQSFNDQIAQYTEQLNSPTLQLTATELPLYQAIVDSLQAGKDLIFDEGQREFNFATAAFTGPNSKAVAINCPSDSKFVAVGCWYHGAANESCTQVCTNKKLKVSALTTTYAGSGGKDDDCFEIGAAFGASKGSSFTNQDGIGCMETGNSVYRITSPATTDDAASKQSWTRFCACE